MFRAFFWQRILAGKQPFRIHIAYYSSFFFDHTSKYQVNIEGERIIFRKMPAFLFSPIGLKKCIIVDFYGGFLLNKNGYQTIIHVIFHLPIQT
jgi:hypothetical protein